MGVRSAAWGDLLRRYVSVFLQAWRARREYAPVPRAAAERAFLPAGLALQETPPHPAPRVAMALILCFAVLALAWALFGHVDVVATATGRIIPDSRSKIVQPLEAGVVRLIHVKDGQFVRAGDLLLELDATVVEADVERLEGDLRAARREILRNELLLASLDTGRRPGRDDLPPDLVDVRRETELALIEGRRAAFESALAQIDAEIVRREAERRATEALVDKLRHMQPIVQQRAEDYRGLLDKRFVSKHGYLELEQSRIELERDLVVQREKLAEIAASRVEAEQQKARLIAETRRDWLDRLRDADDRAEAIAQELVKARSRDRHMRLLAPSDGYVQQLAIHTVGGVVTPAQALMVVVPTDSPLEVEAFVPNKDIGFVRYGQAVEVKVETFAFTKYGTIEGEIVHLSSDAIQDERMGLVFGARVRLAQDHIDIDGRPVRLSPGMAVTVEVKTGKRRLIEYFLGPLLQYSNESLRER